VGIEGAREKGANKERKGERERERERESSRSLFVCTEDLKHVVPLYTRIVRIEIRKIKEEKGKKLSIGGMETAEESDGAPTRGERVTHREGPTFVTKREETSPSCTLYCFCVRLSRREKDRAEGVRDTVRGRCEREDRYRLSEICIFVGHSSLPR